MYWEDPRMIPMGTSKNDILGRTKNDTHGHIQERYQWVDLGMIHNGGSRVWGKVWHLSTPLGCFKIPPKGPPAGPTSHRYSPLIQNYKEFLMFYFTIDHRIGISCLLSLAIDIEQMTS